MKKVLYYFVVTLCIISFQPSHAADSATANKFIKKIENVLFEPIPSLEKIMPHYNRPKEEKTGLIVGVFTNNSSDGVNWGLVLSEMIRVNLYSLPENPVDIGNLKPSILQYDARTIYFKSDQFVELTNIENLKALAQRYAIDRILTGSINESSHWFEVKLELFNLKTKEKIELLHTFQKQELKVSLRRLIEWVYQNIGGNSEQDLKQIAQLGPENMDLVSEFAPVLEKFYQNENSIIPKEFSEQLTLETNFPTAHFYQILSQEAGSSVDEHNQQIDKISRLYPGFQAIQSVAALSFWHLNQAGLLKTKINKLKNIIATSSVEYSGFLELVGALGNNGTPLEAVAIACEEILRWPARHRSWWQLSYALEKLAWHYRGDNFWHQVPEKGKRVFANLIDLSKESIDHAIQLHPTSGGAYGNRVALHRGYSEEMYNDFLKAIQYDPFRKYIYSNALNYASPKWGGSIVMLNKIYQKAVEQDLPQYQLDQLHYDYLEPHSNHPANLLSEFSSLIGLPKGYLNELFFQAGFANKKTVIFWSGALALFFLSVFFIRQTHRSKRQREMILNKSQDLLSKVTAIQNRLRLEDKTLIVERHEGGVVLPQIEQYYYLFYTPEGLKIDSHFGEINGEIDQASETVVEVINAGVKRHFHS